MPALESQATNVRTKSVYEPAEPSDGRRVLVTQYWPRGIPKTAVDEYVRILAPTRELLQSYRAGRLAWDAFRQQYVEQMSAPEAREQMQRLAEQASAQPITLLCVCGDAAQCHRSLLQGLMTNSATGRRDRSGKILT